MVSFPVLAAIHTGLQGVAALLVVALSFALSSHDASKLDVFVGLAPVLATLLFAKGASGRVAPMSLEWRPLVALALLAAAVTFALTYYLGPIAAHDPRHRGWWAICAALAFFELVVAVRMLMAARDGRV